LRMAPVKVLMVRHVDLEDEVVKGWLTGICLLLSCRGLGYVR
jgi:hypothetical protein